ncbi:tail fiber domain-containing protein [Aquimarina sp. MMG016]|uniref:tail fiber domain-containing protein n=1 Tax=Aquimarina sp. MMG016 TaxID=2822690 RepID=UPI001B3A7AA5|nr:tail fiber domain-containing protein [Aquimarina sp. MMG016]MBQ4820678.1 tail fiber domain-containing protein [Aquimarina sp. MMG016]
MKKLLLVICGLLAGNMLLAQSPQGFNYQTVVRDTNGDVLADQSIGFEMQLLEDSTTGTTIYTETHMVTTNAQGVATMIIGQGTTTDDFTTVDWSNHIYYLQVAVDASGGSNYSVVGLSQLVSVPYALHAKTSEDSTFTTVTNVTSNSKGDYTNDDIVFGSPSLDNDGDTTHDNRMFFDKSKAAFRAGSGTGTDWDTANIGDYSIAFGRSTIASGSHAVASGWDTEASGYASTAMGIRTEATDDAAVAWGNGTNATHRNATAWGLNNTASGYASTAFGAANNATLDRATAFGVGNTASGQGATVWGLSNTASSYYETVLGAYSNEVTGEANSWTSTDRLFAIGNGTSDTNRSNALTIYKDGTININDSYNLPLVDGSSGQVITTNGNGTLSWVDDATDNLGNHTATENIQLSDKWLSNDGENKGIRIDADGNVGIGTVPLTGFALDMAGASGSDVIHRVRTNDRGGIGQVYVSGFSRYLKLAANDSGSSFEGIPDGETGLASNTPIVLSSNGNPNVSLEDNGTVGIGKLNPSGSFALDVGGDVNVDGDINVNSFTTTKMVADTLGIANSNPEYKLDIGGGFGENAIQRISTGNNGVSELWLRSAAVRNTRLISNSLSSSYEGIPSGGTGIASDQPFYISINEGINFSINSSGNVGIGTNGAQNGYKLDVNGSAIVSDELQASIGILDTLGIGTDNPGFALDMTGADGEDVIHRVRTSFRGGVGQVYVSGFSRYIKLAANDSGTAFEGIPDGETGLVSNRDMVFSSNENINLSLEDDGSVGIGTTVPALGYKLDINGNTSITGSLRMIDGNQQDGYIMVSDATGLASWQDTNGFDNQTLSLATNTLSISNGNSVDLSPYLDDTDTDDQFIDVFQLNGNSLELSLDNDGIGTQSVDLSSVVSASNGLSASAGNVTLGGALSQDTNIDLGSQDMIYNTTSGGEFLLQKDGVNKFEMNLNGGILFGTDLSFRDGSTSGTQLFSMIDDTNSGRFRIFRSGVASVDLNADKGYTFNENSADLDFRIESDNDENMFVIDASANAIGIGTNSPAANIDIEGNGDGEALLRFSTDRSWQFENENTGSNAELTLRSLVDNKFFNIKNSDGAVVANFNAQASPRVYLAPNGGRVGIGTTTPLYELQVGENGDGTEARANAWNTFSDRRWKKDFKVIQNALEKIQAINGYYYKWKDKPDTSTQVGVIAQEIEVVLPEVVATDDNGYKSVDYSKLTALLIEGMKEQETRIQALETQVNKIDRLEALVSELLNKSNNTPVKAE